RTFSFRSLFFDDFQQGSRVGTEEIDKPLKPLFDSAIDFIGREGREVRRKFRQQSFELESLAQRPLNAAAPPPFREQTRNENRLENAQRYSGDNPPAVLVE